MHCYIYTMNHAGERYRETERMLQEGSEILIQGGRAGLSLNSGRFGQRGSMHA